MTHRTVELGAQRKILSKTDATHKQRNRYKNFVAPHQAAYYRTGGITGGRA
jgi:hypothetical protein